MGARRVERSSMFKGRTRLIAIVTLVTLGMLAAVTQLGVPAAVAAGPAYDGPTTLATGPAFFGPAPNPFPYCENPTYFDPFPENENPIGRIDVTGSPNASVETNGITMTFELTGEGAPDTQYPGFFPEGADGGPGDQPKGIEMASDDAAVIALSEPLFYTQWIFTDVDRANEGFFVTPTWTSAPGQIALFGGDSNFDFTGSTAAQAVFNDTDTVSQDSEALEGRVQVDVLGASTGLTLLRDTGSGQSGFAVGGGCEPLGVAKEVTSGPTWNGTSYDVTYTIRVRNNLPSTATIGADVDAALAAAASGLSTGTPVGIELTNLTLQDLLADTAFGTVTVVTNTNTSGLIETNPAYDGVNDVDLVLAGETIPAETEEEFVLVVQYTPDAAGPLGAVCSPYTLTNQAIVGGTADGVDVLDESDDGADPDPGVDNNAGGVDDPSPVAFECPVAPPASLEIVKTVVAGPAGTCPSFDEGIVGAGAPLEVELGASITYCISVRNPSTVDIDNVVVSDPQAPASFTGAIGTLAAGADETVSFDLVVDPNTPTTNTASVTGTDPGGGDLPPVEDPAVIVPAPINPAIDLSKTVVAGDGDCAAAVEGVDERVVGEVGDAIIWCFVVTNTGDVALTNVLFNDGPAGIVDRNLIDGEVPPILAVGDSVTFDLEGTIPAGGVDNVATVSGTPATPDGTPIPNVPDVDDTDDAAIADIAMTLQKQVVAGENGDCAAASELTTVNVGTMVTYCFTVTNTGSVRLLVTEIEDVTLNLTVPIPAASQVLAPGDTVTVSVSAVAAVDLVNTATTTGIPVDENDTPIPNAPRPTPEDPAEVDTLEANISIVKSNSASGPQPVASVVTYTLLIANAGPDAAQNVVVVDSLPAGLAIVTMPTNADWDCTSASDREFTCTKLTELATDETSTLSYGAQILDAAPSNTALVNTATVSSDTPDPDPSDNEDTESVTKLPPQAPPEQIVPITQVPPGPPGPPNPQLPSPEPPTVPPLVVTGAQSALLASAAVLLAMLGGVFFVGGRRQS